MELKPGLSALVTGGASGIGNSFFSVYMGFDVLLLVPIACLIIRCTCMSPMGLIFVNCVGLCGTCGTEPSFAF